MMIIKGDDLGDDSIVEVFYNF